LTVSQNDAPMVNAQEQFRHIPPVDRLLQDPLAQSLQSLYGRDALVNAIRVHLTEVRAWLQNGQEVSLTSADLLRTVQSALERQFAPGLRPVINATGVLIHTNLGRVLLSNAAQRAVQEVANSYSNLEYDLEAGKRGSRYVHAEELLKELTGAEAALVVNNNAAALVLMLATLAAGRSVVISRSQLVEIGGGFRIPEIMEQSGARLVEVGTTNRTRVSDYERACDATTAMLLRVHSSNFRIIGFVEQPELHELAQVAQQRGVLLVDDIGSGALLDTGAYGLAPEPTVQQSLAAGADLVLFSGDKLLGGPQAGILVGRGETIAALKRHPLARALRADKLCYAALQATLDHYRKGEATTEIPIWRMIATPLETIRERAQNWSQNLGRGEVIAGESTVGGGSLPGTSLPTFVLALDVPSADEFVARLRTLPLPVIARIAEGRVLLDPRSVPADQDDLLLTMLRRVF
jgi:L-seryl-tRNA(Ser) seleniumtransferase